ncbi:MAG TPA: glutathione synthase [Myxococcota bacterium]|nr:glutathione synthase [Myxococcota bacterium]
MRHLFIVDPLRGLNPDADTSVMFMREVARRGHGVATCDVSELSVGPDGCAHARFVETRVRESRDWFEVGGASEGSLGEFDVVWMRKDPPYDLNYFFATHILDLVPQKTLVVNAPSGLREVTEKLFILRFPDLCPESLVSRSIRELLAFRDKLGGEMIIKPLDGCGGEGVFHLTKDDRNVQALLELGTKHGSTYQIAQRYIPEVRSGDKRIIVVEGEPVGGVLRVPQHYESRANFHVGGRAQKAELSAREREICARIGPALRAHGIVFAGIDVIGDWLTEVNVTSPTGIQEINRLNDVQLEKLVVDAVERRQRALA